MKQTGKAIITLAILILLGMPRSAGAQQATEEMSIWRARYALIAASQYAGVARSGMHYHSVNPSSIRLNSESLEFDATNTKGHTLHLRVALKDIETYSASCSDRVCWVQSGPRRGFSVQDDVEQKAYVINFGDDPSPIAHPLCSRAQNHDDCVHAAGWFASALNGLHAFAILHPAAAGDFHQQAAAWRALTTKPPLAEGARVRRLAAEDAIKRQKPYEALNYYELGVEVDPMWAQGWFNAAVVAASLGYYADAVEHMQSYLELVPDATDAQSARDQIDLWRYKAGQQQPVPGK
jgi:hypothetical protein